MLRTFYLNPGYVMYPRFNANKPLLRKSIKMQCNFILIFLLHISSFFDEKAMLFASKIGYLKAKACASNLNLYLNNVLKQKRKMRKVERKNEICRSCAKATNK